MQETLQYQGNGNKQARWVGGQGVKDGREREGVEVAGKEEEREGPSGMEDRKKQIVLNLFGRPHLANTV